MPPDTIQRFEFAHAQGEYGWLLYLFLAAAVVLGYFAWRRYGPAPAGRAGAIARGCRVAVIVLTIFLLAGPTFKNITILREPGELLVLADRSASMAATDAFLQESLGQPRVAAVPLLDAALEALPAGSTAERWIAIGGDVAPLPDATRPPEATGTASPLGEEIEELVLAQRPDCTIVVTDGRVTAGSDLAAVAADLQAAGLPKHGVWILGVGSEQVDPELHIDEIIAPREVPLGERQPILAKLSARGLGEEPLTLRIRAGDRILDEIVIEAPAAEDDLAPVNLEAVLDRVVLHQEGEQRLRLEVEQGGLSANSEFVVDVRERDLKVLILAHRPRYELRYLREALDRDPSITVHSYLADGRWRPWRKVPTGLERLPLDPESIALYDVILIGDLGPDRLTDPEMANIAKAVREGGAGLVWLPGEAGATARFAPTVLGKLLPARLPNPAAIMQGYLANTPLQISRTDFATEHGLLQAEGTEWDLLPPPLGACPIDPEDGPLPGSRVLLVDQEDRPLVVVSPFGAGQALLVAIDDSWRWRPRVADRYLHDFWSQLLRYVSANKAGDQRKWRLVPSPQRSIRGELVQLGVVPVGASPDAASLPRQITVRLSGPNDAVRHVTLNRAAGEASYLAKVPAPEPGTWLLEVLDLAQPVTDAELVVLPPGDEIRDPRIDRPALEELATTTGGRVFFIDPAGDNPAATAEALVAALPSLAKERQRVDLSSIWDSWWWLVVLLVLLSIEWSLRRWNRLP